MFIGFMLAILSGICYGACYVPVRYINKFAWENIWFLQSFLKLVIFPIALGAFTIPSFFELYREIGWRVNLLIVVGGLYAGISTVLLGLALVRTGMAVANSLANGVSIVTGAFIPLIIQHREAMRGALGASLLLGTAFAILGVTYCALAASRQQQESAYMDPEQQRGRSHSRIMLVGVLLAVASGMLPASNLGLAFAGDYVRLAKARGTSDVFSALALFVPLSAASFSSSSIYYGLRWKRNGTLVQFRGPHMLRYGVGCLLIATVWFAAMVLYGWAMPWMKSFGPIIGWPVCLTVQLLSSAVIEYFYGDWRGRALGTLSFALAALTISVALFAYANSIIQRAV